jgi:hypothetical protein
MNIKNLFLLITAAFIMITPTLSAAADAEGQKAVDSTITKPIVVFVEGPLRHIDSRIKFTITPESVEVIYLATGAILPIPFSAKVFTIGPSTPGGKDFTVSADPNASIHIYATRIEILSTGVKVSSYNYNGDSNSKTTHWCGCITTWFCPNRGVADPEELHKCDACKNKEQADAQYAADLKAIDRLIEKQNEDMENWLLR